MTLGRKTLALFLLLGLAICAGSYVALRVTVVPTFEEFERTASSEALSRATQLLDSKLEALGIINVEYSAWNDTVRYLEDRNEAYREENLAPGYWHSIDIDFLATLDADGELVYGWLLHPTEDHQLAFDDELLEPLRSGHVLVGHDSVTGKVAGLLRTRSGLLAVTSRPVTRSDQTGDIAGTFIIGQFLTSELVDELGRQATADTSLHQLGLDALPVHVVSAFRDLRDQAADSTVVTYGSNVHGLRVLRDVYGSSEPF